MKALVLTAARSKKLSPYSDTRPKSMIPIAGEFILETILKQLQKAGVQEVWIVVNHQRQVIQDYFHYGKQFGLKLDYIVQAEARGIGHAVSLCEEVIGDEENFLLVYGDALMSGNPFVSLLERFETTTPQALATISHPASEGRYGNIYLSHDMKISKLIEKPEKSRLSNYIFGGSFILNRNCFDFLSQHEQDILAYFQHLISENQLDASVWEDDWIDISRPWHILGATQMMMRSWTTTVIPKSVHIEPNVTIKGPVRFGENVHIGSGTTIVGPCSIGADVYIGDNCLIRANVAIGDNSEIGYGTEIKNSILFGKTIVGRLSFIGDSVLGEHVQFGSGTLTVNYDTLGREIYFHSEGEEPVKTYQPKLGAFIGDHSIIGTGHTIAPGTKIPSSTRIGDRITISDDTIKSL